MKLLYLTFIDENNKNNIGVIKKIKGQVKAYNNNLVECYHSFINEEGLNIWFNDKKMATFKFGTLLNKRLSQRIGFYSEIINFINNNEIKVIYIRYYFSEPFFINFLKRCKENGLKIIIEIPTYPYKNEMKSKLLYNIDYYYSKKIKKYVDIIVTYSKHNSIFGVKTIKIENGIDMDSIKLSRNNDEDYINLLGVANVNFWNGYDRLIEGLNVYYKERQSKKKVIFTIVGDGPELINLKNMVSQYKLQDYVFFKGVLYGSQLDHEFDLADLCVSSLGVHRLGLDSMSTLKSKEYWARGVPFLKSYKDDQIDSIIKDFILTVNSDDSYINISNVITFYNELKQKNKNYKYDMRVLASKNITWDIQLKQIINQILYWEKETLK